MSIGHTQVFAWIHRSVVNPNLVVEVRPGATSAVAYIPDGVATMNILARKHGECLQVPVTGADSVPVVQNDCASVPAHKISELNNPIRRSNHRLPKNSANINTRVECALTVERINALSKGASNLAFNWPKIRRGIGPHPISRGNVPGQAKRKSRSRGTAKCSVFQIVKPI